MCNLWGSWGKHWLFCMDPCLPSFLPPNHCSSIPSLGTRCLSAAGKDSGYCRGDFCLAKSPHSLENGQLESSSERCITVTSGSLGLWARLAPREAP